MKAFWHGASGASPNNTAVTYNFLTADMQCGWPGFEYGNTTNAGRSTPLTDTVEITEVRVWITNAPGTGKSWTFAVRDDAVTTAASVTIADAAVSGGWTGSVTIAAGSLANLISTPSGTPAGTGQMHWVVTYQTAGNFYLALGGGQTANTGSVTYPQMSGCADAGAQTSSTEWAQLAPTGFSVTKLGIANLAQVGGSGSNTVVVRKNNTTDSTGVTMTAGNQSAIGSITSFAVAAGDTIIMKLTPAGGAAWGNFSTCATIVPDTAGEIAVFFGGGAGPSTSTTTYEGPQGLGNGAWNATENLVAYRFIPCTLKKFYVLLSAAPGSGKSWAVTVREQVSDTALTTSIATAATSGNDTAHTELVAIMGSLIAVKAVPSGTPAGTQMRFSFVAVIGQDLNSTISPTMKPVVASLSGAESIAGTLAVTMKAPVTAMTGASTAAGTMAVTLQKAVAALTGSETAAASLAASLQRATMSATGAEAVNGVLAATLQKAVASFAGEIFATNMTAVLKKAVMSGTGAETVPGVLAATLAKMLFSGSGGESVPATLAATMQPLEIVMHGTSGPRPPLPDPGLPPIRFATPRVMADPQIVSPTQIITLRTAKGVQIDQLLSRDQINLTWSREKRETSRCELAGQSYMSASGRVPDIQPWIHWVDVWDDIGRDLLWTGPVTKFSGNDEQLTVSALDVSAFTTKTRVPMTKRWDATDPALIANELYERMLEHHGLNVKPLVRPDPLGDKYDFKTTADDGQLDKVIDDLVGRGMTWTVVNGVPILGPWVRQPQAAFGKKDFVGGSGLTITRDGTNMFNDVLLRSGDQKSYAKVPMGGLALQQTIDIDDIFGVSNTDRALKSSAAYTGKVRDMISLTDGAVLKSDAPVTIDQLIPTARFTIQAYDSIYLMELTRVEVTTSAGNVQVSIALEGVDDELPELVELQTKRYGGGQ